MKKLKKLYSTLKYKVETKTLGKKVMVVMLVIMMTLSFANTYSKAHSPYTVLGNKRLELYESEGIESGSDLEWIMKQIHDFTS